MIDCLVISVKDIYLTNFIPHRILLGSIWRGKKEKVQREVRPQGDLNPCYQDENLVS